ncbi:MAG: exodeoxyribonuclease VII small subunit [Defluviitaleaceae bacterium]|nr:exodeoxyribonuclease VII small subunit [Defluviitaleaceae bacterium]
MPKKQQSFEKSLSRLTEIVETIEDGDTTLEDAIKLYKEGLTRAEDCGNILSRYETEVLQLQKDADGAFALALFGEGVKANANT